MGSGVRQSQTIRLYHDVDGVLFGQYGPEQRWQLRPGLSDWLQWVLAHFQLVWLTSWAKADIDQLLTQTYNASVATKARYVLWQGSKVEALLADVTPHMPWLWIDDEPWEADGLQALGLGERFLQVNAGGLHELDSLKGRLRDRAKALGWWAE